MLNYALYPNELTRDDPNDQMAKPVDIVTNNLEDLIKAITGPGSILKATEVNAVIAAYWQAIADFISKGESYSDQFIKIRFDISGVFQDENDVFSPERHTLVVGVVLKDTVTGVVSEIPTKKVDARTTQPVIESVYDWGSDTSSDQLTPGDVLEITGSSLKIHNNLEEEGIYFVNMADNTETIATRIRTNEPKTLRLRVPELAGGTYQLSIRNTRHDGKSLRVGLMAQMLTVAAPAT
jgi:hypothetical protein